MRTRYGKRHDCSKCGKSAKFYRVKQRRSYACEHCGAQVYPTAGTPFDRTRTSLRDWFYVMFLFCTTRHGVAAKEVEQQIGVTYKTAWRMCHEIRKYMAQVDGDTPTGGQGDVVEVDETLVGGKSEGQGNFRDGEGVGPAVEDVNGLEGFGSQLKCGINGTHIHVSPQHLAKYLSEFEFRHSRRYAPHAMLEELLLAFQR